MRVAQDRREYTMTFLKAHLRLVQAIALILTLSFLTGTACLCEEHEIKTPEWADRAVIYEVNVRQYTKEGTFASFGKHLPRLKAMGIDILWLMPIHPIGKEKRKGTRGSYYSVKDYYAVNPEFGSMSDLKALVKQAHGSGMKVIVDWVAGHTSWDNRLIATHPEYYKKGKSGEIISPVPDWSDVAALDYGNPATAAYMIEAMRYWITAANIDGFRCDTAQMLPPAFWVEARRSLDRTKKIYMLAEGENTETFADSFDAMYAWKFLSLAADVAKGKASASDLTRWCETYDSSDCPPCMYFTSNHDENSWNGSEYERLGTYAQSFAAMTWMLPGIPLVYSGQEAELNRKLLFFEKDEISWQKTPLAGFYAKLASLRHTSSALATSNTKGFRTVSSTDTRLFSFERFSGNEKIVFVLNTSASDLTAEITDKEAAGSFTDYFTGKETVLGKGKKITVQGCGFAVLIKGMSLSPGKR